MLAVFEDLIIQTDGFLGHHRRLLNRLKLFRHSDDELRAFQHTRADLGFVLHLAEEV